MNLWFLDVRLAQVHLGRERPGLFYGCFGGNDQQRGRWIRGEFLLVHVLLVAINAQFLGEGKSIFILTTHLVELELKNH